MKQDYPAISTTPNNKISMRSISALFVALLIFSCSSKNSIMSHKEFAKLYVDSLTKRYPVVKFDLNEDLTITSKKGELEFKHYTDNAFIAYKAEPDAINDIVRRYIASTTDLYEKQGIVNIENIIPVIKPNEYLDEINSLSKDGEAFPMLTEKYNDQLIIAYAEDSKNSIKYLTEDDLKMLSISKDSLKSIALRNFDKIIPNIQRQGDNELFMITAGGDYEASLILLSSIWTKENLPVDGEFIIAIPNRDMLLITGSKSKTGIAKIKEIVADSYKTGNYQVSDHLYKWTGGKFELYK